MVVVVVLVVVDVEPCALWWFRVVATDVRVGGAPEGGDEPHDARNRPPNTTAARGKEATLRVPARRPALTRSLSSNRVTSE